MQDEEQVILASASPRRRDILNALGMKFSVEVAAVDENLLPGERPTAHGRRLAWQKARAVSLLTEGVVIGADTIVVRDEAILGKPVDEAEAWSMLRALRGHEHSVISSLAIINTKAGLAYVASTTTVVYMRGYTDEEIAAYIASGEPFDKAGGYAIQSESFHPVARIEGCYLNVVGLPACELVRGLRLVAPALNWQPRPDLLEDCVSCSDASVLYGMRS